MEIEIQRGQKIYKNKPESVNILLIGDDGESRAAIHVFPKADPKSDLFRVEMSVGNVAIKPPVLFEADI